MAEDSVSATPRNSGLGAIADALSWLQQQGNKVDLRDVLGALPGAQATLMTAKAANPDGRMPLGDTLLGKMPQEVNEWSYGNAPMTVPEMSSVPQFKRGRADSVADTLLAAPMVGQVADLGLQGAKVVGRAVAENAGKTVPRSLAQQGAIRLRGGNMDKDSVDTYLDNLRAGSEDTAVNLWQQKQLRNYLTKDLGSPSDPLLQVEQEGRLHLPAAAMLDPDTLKAIAAGHIGTPVAWPLAAARLKVHASLTDQPLTPWGMSADQAINTSTIGKDLRRWDPAKPVPEWMTKADPNTPTFSVIDVDAGQGLGFHHVTDYLRAASEPHMAAMHAMDDDPKQAAAYLKSILNGEIEYHPHNLDTVAKWRDLDNAGLTLSPEDIGKTSVADAVRKTHRWNELLANKMQEANPELAKGIKAVHKEYPEEGMRWVQLGAADTTPESKAALSAGLNAEGDAMGHCVGGYCDDVADRGVQIYSLRDKNNQPHVTVEVAPRYKTTSDAVYDHLGLNKSHADADAVADYSLWRAQAKKPGGDSFENLNKFLESVGRPPLNNPMDIKQIKGKQNAAPVDKYKKFAQDFVRSGDWGTVGDLRNAGMKDMNDYISSPWGQYMKAQGAEMPSSRYTTDAEEAAVKQHPAFETPVTVRPNTKLFNMLQEAGVKNPEGAYHPQQIRDAYKSINGDPQFIEAMINNAR